MQLNKWPQQPYCGTFYSWMPQHRWVLYTVLTSVQTELIPQDCLYCYIFSWQEGPESSMFVVYSSASWLPVVLHIDMLKVTPAQIFFSVMVPLFCFPSLPLQLVFWSSLFDVAQHKVETCGRRRSTDGYRQICHIHLTHLFLKEGKSWTYMKERRGELTLI